MTIDSPRDTSPAIPYGRLGSLYYLLNYLGMGAYMPFLFVYYSELGITGQQIGWISVLGPLLTLLLATPIAALADRRRWRTRILQLALAGQIITLVTLGVPHTFGWIAGLMLIMAIVASPIMAVSDSLIARMAQRHGANFGAMRLWGSLGYAISALGFGVVWQWLGFKPMFGLSALFLVPLIWLANRFPEPPASAQNARQPAVALLRDTSLATLLLATVFAAIANSLAMTFGGIYVRALGGNDVLVGLMVAVSATSEILTMFFSEHLVKRLQGIPALILAYGLMASAYLGWVLVPNPNAIVIFAVLRGLGYGLWLTVTVRLITERTPEAQAATAQSLLAVSLAGLAPLIAGPTGGWIHDMVGAGAVFALGVLALVMAIVIMAFLAAKSPHSAHSPDPGQP